MIKILHVATSKHWGGGEQQLWYLYHALNRLNIDQMILGAPHSKLVKKCQEEPDIRWLTFRTPISSLSIIAALQLKNCWKQYQPDLIHLHDSHAHNIAIIAASLSKHAPPMILSRKVVFNKKIHRLSRYKIWSSFDQKNDLCQ